MTSADEPIIDGFKVHPKVSCTPPCPFHAPSDHPLKDAPMHIRSDKYMLVERICEHGIGHDDPDSVAYMHAHGQDWAGVHGCDGCCTPHPDAARPAGEVLTEIRVTDEAMAVLHGWVSSGDITISQAIIDHDTPPPGDNDKEK